MFVNSEEGSRKRKVVGPQALVRALGGDLGPICLKVNELKGILRNLAKKKSAGSSGFARKPCLDVLEKKGNTRNTPPSSSHFPNSNKPAILAAEIEFFVASTGRP